MSNIPSLMVAEDIVHAIHEIDWKENEWFYEHHYDKLSYEFKYMWVKEYDKPGRYVDRDWYWQMCSAALLGFEYGKKIQWLCKR